MTNRDYNYDNIDDYIPDGTETDMQRILRRFLFEERARANPDQDYIDLLIREINDPTAPPLTSIDDDVYGNDDYNYDDYDLDIHDEEENANNLNFYLNPSAYVNPNNLPLNLPSQPNNLPRASSNNFLRRAHRGDGELFDVSPNPDTGENEDKNILPWGLKYLVPPTGGWRMPRKGDVCGICFEPFYYDSIIVFHGPVLTPHYFHNHCIKTWYKSKPNATCPFDRQNFGRKNRKNKKSRKNRYSIKSKSVSSYRKSRKNGKGKKSRKSGSI